MLQHLNLFERLSAGRPRLPVGFDSEFVRLAHLHEAAQSRTAVDLISGLSFINSSVTELVQAQAGLIDSRVDFKNNAEVRAAFLFFANECTQPCPFAEWIDRRIKAQQGMNFSQWLAEGFIIYARRQSTDRQIPAVVSALHNMGLDHAASLVQENLDEELGIKTCKDAETDPNDLPHSKLFIAGLQAALGALWRNHPYDPGVFCQFSPDYFLGNIEEIFSTAIKILCRRDVFGDEQLKARPELAKIFTREFLNYESFKDLTRLGQEDFEKVIDWCDKIPAAVAHYYRAITAEIDCASIASPWPHYIAPSIIHFATREALSTKNAFVSAHGILQEHILGYVPGENERRLIERYYYGHNDVATGQALGWDHSAEEGHALDGIKVLDEFVHKAFPGGDPESSANYVYVLYKAAYYVGLQRQWAEASVNWLKELEFNAPIPYKPANSSRVNGRHPASLAV